MDTNNITSRLRDALIDKGIKQKELCLYINVAPSTFNNWIKLNRSIPSEYLIPICEFLNINLTWLLTGKENITSLTIDQKELVDLYSQLDHDEQTEFKGELRGYIKAKKKSEPKKTLEKMSVKELLEQINIIENLIEKSQGEELPTLEENVDYIKNA